MIVNQNKNIFFLTKNENRIKIFSGNKWVYKGKEEIISDLVERESILLWMHTDSVSDKLNTSIKLFKKFKEYFNDNDKELESLRKECELVLLNNR